MLQQYTQFSSYIRRLLVGRLSVCLFMAVAILPVAISQAVESVPSSVASSAIRFVPFHQVAMDDVIWQPRIRQLVRDTLPHALRQTEVAQRRLRMCAEWLESGGKTPKPEPHRFNTSDLYKVMEGAALMLKAEPNPQIEAELDRIIDVIARAQQDDGYLYVPHITGSIREHEMGARPYSHLVHSHELYNVGHLYEAAVAYAQATGKRKLLDVAEKNAAHVQRVIFQGGDKRYNDARAVMQAPGHQEIELGLLKLYAFTGKPLYLQMAKRFLDIRGVTYQPDGQGVNSPQYAQQHRPVSEQQKAVGHAVRATYQYAAMAEVDSLTQRDDYSDALHSIWSNIVNARMHLTGGLGAVHGIEGFGPDYVLPNKDTYLETCAAVGNVLFNVRMFLKYGDAQYLDVAEIALLNNCLAGVGHDGISFFYPNPLEADAGHRPRSGWFGTACCPSNIARLIPQVSGYMYAVAASEDRLYCTLYGQNTTELRIGDTQLGVRQQTDYPWDGTVRLELSPKKRSEFGLCLRIPAWARQQLVPGKLYQFTDGSQPFVVRVNGEKVKAELQRGFVELRRVWSRGDVVTLELPMPVRASRCDQRVKANRNRVAFSRGPLVLCAEQVDNGGAVQRLVADPAAAERATLNRFEAGLLAGVPSVSLPGMELAGEGGTKPVSLNLVPYFAWSNRDRGSMITWLPTDPDLAHVDPLQPDQLRYAAANASHTFEGDTVAALRQRGTPKSSADKSIPRWTSWPQRGKPQWVEVKLQQPKAIRSVGVYFYDDAGGVQIPQAWHVEVPVAEGWRRLEIYNTDSYSVLKDAYNTVHPAEPVTTDRLRVVMRPRHDQTTVGILSLDVQTVTENGGEGAEGPKKAPANRGTSAEQTTPQHEPSPNLTVLCGREHTEWTLQAPLLSSGPQGGFDEVAVKDPSVVRFDGRWHVFYTARGQGEYTTGYVNGRTWQDLASAERHELAMVRGRTRYGCAPQVFYFEPQDKWYLIFQNRDANYQPMFTTCQHVDRPGDWAAAKPLLRKDRSQKWIDFWVICDDSHAYLFYTQSQHGVYMRRTSLEQFPSGWGEPELVFDDVHEAVHVYRVRGEHEYHMIYELNERGQRSFGLAAATKLQGPWRRITDEYATGEQLQAAESSNWTDMVSHGEAIRCSHDQRLEYNPRATEWLIQGVKREQLTADYPSIPWRLGLITRRTSTLRNTVAPVHAPSETERPAESNKESAVR